MMAPADYILVDDQLDKMTRLDDALGSASSPSAYAFGGSIALDYYTEPRATTDFDVNIACSERQSPEVLSYLRKALPDLEIDERVVAIAQKDGQVRIGWGQYKLDLFFANTDFHEAIAQRVHLVPFLDREIPIIAEEHLIACKAIFNRTKDWLDIEDMLSDAPAGLDAAEAHNWVSTIAVADISARLDALFVSHGFSLLAGL
ncbi:MAG: hypothetical protein M1420_06405 [Actinobacteria bacterium]|nr:hypothetical protein [Actinomycetota bacterium]